MRLPLTRVASVLLMTGITLSPLVASAQNTGTNGQVYFISADTNSNLSIAAANSDGTESHYIVTGTSSDNIQFYAVSPDGTKLAYVDGATKKIMFANADGSSSAAIYTPTGQDQIGHLAISADNATVFFGLNSDATATNNGIYKVASTGGSATQIVPDTSIDQYEVGSILVSSSNSKLYFGDTQGGSGAARKILSSSFTGLISRCFIVTRLAIRHLTIFHRMVANCLSATEHTKRTSYTRFRAQEEPKRL